MCNVFHISQCILTAYFWGSPGNAHTDLVTSLSVCCHCGTEALTVSSAVAGTRVSYTVFIKWSRIQLYRHSKRSHVNIFCEADIWRFANCFAIRIIFFMQETRNIFFHYLFVAFLEGFHYNATLKLGPAVSMWLQRARINATFCVRASAWNFPAVCKLQRAANYHLTLGSKVILDISIKVSTKTTHSRLYRRKKDINAKLFSNFYSIVVSIIEYIYIKNTYNTYNTSQFTWYTTILTHTNTKQFNKYCHILN